MPCTCTFAQLPVTIGIMGARCPRSASMITAQLPLQCSSPESIAASFPKFLLKEMYFIFSDLPASFFRKANVSSLLPSFTKMPCPYTYPRLPLQSAQSLLLHYSMEQSLTIILSSPDSFLFADLLYRYLLTATLQVPLSHFS